MTRARRTEIVDELLIGVVLNPSERASVRAAMQLYADEARQEERELVCAVCGQPLDAPPCGSVTRGAWDRSGMPSHSTLLPITRAEFNHLHPTESRAKEGLRDE